MTRIKRAGPPIVIVALITGIVGYILGCTNSELGKQSEARAAQADAVAKNDQTSPATAASAKPADSADQAASAKNAAAGS